MPSICSSSSPLPAPLEGWSSLMPDLIRRIVEQHLPCGIDRLRLSWTNKHWGSTIAEMKLPELPWMFQPSSTAPTFFNPLSRCVHSIWLPPDLKHGFVSGSYGPWAFITVYDPEPQQVMYNLCNGETGPRGRIPLPLTVMDKEGDLHEAFLQMATISGPPSLPGYRVVAVVNKGGSYEDTIAVWQYGDQNWVEIATLPEDMFVADMLCYHGAFYLLTADEHLMRLVSQHDGSFRLVRHLIGPRLSKELDDLYEKQDGNSLKRYLVESTGGELLFAVKKFYRNKTVDIRVSRLAVDEAGKATWVVYMNVAGEMTFLGQACSRSVVTQLQATIHFLDDRMEEIEDGIGLYKRDDMGGFQPRVHHFKWFSYGGPDETWFSYRAPSLEEFAMVSDLFQPVWCELSPSD